MSDSHACLTQLRSLPTKPKIIPSILKRIMRHIRKITKKKNKLTFVYVPGHQGIGLNEQADQAAKTARTDGDPSYFNPLTNYYTQKLKKVQRQKTRHRIKQLNIKSDRKDYPKRKPYKTRALAGLFKTTGERNPLLNRARSGHNATKRHLHRLKITDNNTCRHCKRIGSTETIYHQLYKCTTFAQKLQEHWSQRQLNQLLLIKSEFPWSETTTTIKILRKARKLGLFI